MLRKYEYIVELVRNGNFSHAAEKLHISQPSLSQYVKKLEQELGIELFNRGSAELFPTQAGKIYYDGACKIVQLEKELQKHLLDSENGDYGEITVGISPYRNVYFLVSKVAKSIMACL